MKLHHPVFFSLLTLATALFLSVWTAQVHQRMALDRDFSRLLNGDARSVIEATEAGFPIPPRARSRSRLADILTEELFPPSYDRALEEVGQALLLHPLDSFLWVQVARFQLFMGNVGEARAALNVSDQIDPRYPSQRLEAIRLWGLLGDSERAITVARNVARLGSPFREEAGGELAAIGVSSGEIFDIVTEPGLGSEELFNLTRSIIDSDPSRVEETIQELPREIVREPDFRRRLAVLLERTRRFELLLDIWEAEGARLTEVLPGLFVDNSDLAVAPRAGVFPLGWQALGNLSDVLVRWEAAAVGSSAADGHWEVSIGSEADQRIRWRPMYRAILPAGTSVRVDLRIRQDPFYGGIVTWRVRGGSGFLIHGPASDHRVSGWTSHSLVVPAQPRPEVINLELDWERRGIGAGSERTVLRIDGVTFSEPMEGAR